MTPRTPEKAGKWFVLTKEMEERIDDMAEELFACGEQLLDTGMNLHHGWHEMMRRDTWGRERLRLKGYGLLVPVLQALATEYMLKGLSLREKRCYLKTHDLHDLNKGLGLRTKARVALLVVSDIGSKLPKFLEAHRDDFVDWRYVYFEGGQPLTHRAVFDSVLAALIDPLEDVTGRRSAPRSRTSNKPARSPTNPADANLGARLRILATPLRDGRNPRLNDVPV